MTLRQVLERLVPAAEDDDVDTPGDLIHTTSCHDHNRALCGADITGYGTIARGVHPEDCVVCEDLNVTGCGCGCGCC